MSHAEPLDIKMLPIMEYLSLEFCLKMFFIILELFDTQGGGVDLDCSLVSCSVVGS